MIWRLSPDPGPGAGVAIVTRRGGLASEQFGGFNVGLHTGDRHERVTAHRHELLAGLRREGVARVQWLNQVHGDRVVSVAATADATPDADAAVTTARGIALAIMTADCVPVLLVGPRVVAAAHAGWRGLAAGIIAKAVAAMNVPPAQIRALVGPHISGDAYEVDEPVRRAFDGDCRAFRPVRAGHWSFDLGVEAEDQLRGAGVTHVDAVGGCAAGMPRRWYSHRRNAPTSRNVSLVWLRSEAPA